MRQTILTAAIFPAAIAFASCSSAQSGDSAPASTTMSPGGEEVELQSTSPFAATSYGTFDEPWALAFEPGTGRILITEKGGTAHFYDPATGETTEIAGMPAVAYGGQGGLGDIAFAPDYESSGIVYLSWAASADGSARRAVVGRGTLACEAGACEVTGLSEIWQQSVAIESAGHFSHRIEFSPDGQYLFISSGDRMQQDPAQDTSNNLGTVVRLMPDGTPAPGNPMAGEGSPTDQIWTYGQRNILGLQFDNNGNLWGLEHGPAGGDELNLLQPGNNYGWPVVSNGDNYNGVEIPNHDEMPRFVKPAISWNPVIAPGDFIFYSGEMWGDWENDALIANLRTTSIVRVSIYPDSNNANEEARYAFPERLRDIAEAPDGSLWVIEDGESGRLLHLTPASDG